MTGARRDGLLFLLLGSIVFVLLGTVLANSSSAGMVDFRSLYYPARCLIHHSDPYNENEVLRKVLAEGGYRTWDTPIVRQAVKLYLYPPTTFSFTVPFAMLPWGAAHLLWTALTSCSLIIAAFLAWNLGADCAPILSGVLVGFLLANSETVIVVGNISGIAVSLCVVGVWCFLRERFVPAGILCLAVSLAVKPQDAGLIWLYFLLAGGIYRKRALQTLAATAALALPSVLWVWHVAPLWMKEWHANVLAVSAHGGIVDPAPASLAHGLSMLVNLQAIICVFRDDPRIYNPVSYLVCVPLLLLWALVALRSRSSSTNAWLAIAAMSALLLLPVYHRFYDTKLLLLTVPACAMLWAEGGMIGRFALLVNTAAFVLTGDIPWVILMAFIRNLHLPMTGMFAHLLIEIQVFPVPLVLLVMGVFYLWVYASRNSIAAISAKPRGSEEALLPLNG